MKVTFTKSDDYLEDRNGGIPGKSYSRSCVPNGENASYSKSRVKRPVWLSRTSQNGLALLELEQRRDQVPENPDDGLSTVAFKSEVIRSHWRFPSEQRQEMILSAATLMN